MIVRALCDQPPPELARALEQFETQFVYPLGPGRSFRISHGADYPRFFRAMGEAACFVAERDGCVLGTLGAALRRLVLPDGRAQRVLYLGDLKVAPSARGGRALSRLLEKGRQWVGTRVEAAFGVVMDGTPVVPTRYTGRLGIPPFRELGKVVVLRLSAAGASPDPDDGFPASAEQGEACSLRLSAGRYASPGGDPAERSETEPAWLIGRGGAACGRLEDTRRAKRLIADDGVEMRSAHLSCFAYRDVQTGAALIRSAVGRAAARGFPALFVAVADPDGEAVYRCLEGTEIVAAPATVYGAGLEPGPLWNVNTAEI